MRPWIVLTVLAMSLAPAQAQSRLPRVSPAEQSYTDINRSLQRQEQSLTFQQQNQFELNQLRQERDRLQNLPPPSVAVPQICAAGQVTC